LENHTGLNSWWQSLNPTWKLAFAETILKHNNEPTPGELAQIYTTSVLRFAGPTGPYPNMSVELEDLSGIAGLKHLEILVVTHHRLESIRELSGLLHLKSLFLNNNSITSLEGIEGLHSLQQLYVQHNRVGSIEAVKGLINLQELYVHDNLIVSLEGLSEDHAENIRQFFCKPNPGLKQKEIMRVERDLGIRCQAL
jgi:Leucine-rich repeat (LRR) protein